MKGSTGSSMGGRITRRKQTVLEKNTGFCPVCASVKGEPCKDRTKSGRPFWAKRTHTSRGIRPKA